MGTDGPASGPSRLFAELKRRNVVRVALVYLGTAWLIVQFGYSLREARRRGGVSSPSSAGAVRARRLVSSAIFCS